MPDSNKQKSGTMFDRAKLENPNAWNEEVKPILRPLKAQEGPSTGNPCDRSRDIDEAARRALQREERAKRLGIPKAYWWALPKEASHLCPDVNTRRSIFIYGPNGTGKTYLAAALAWKWEFRWHKVSLLMARIRRCFKPHTEETEFSVIETLAGMGGIVLDDLFAASKTDFGFATIYTILDCRIDALKPSIVTSDKSLEDIDRLDSSLASRLSSFERIKVEGPDRRVR